MAKKKIYRTIIQIEVLSEKQFPKDGLSLSDIEYEITDGDCSGKIETTLLNEEIIGERAVAFVKAHGSDSEFFQMDEEGNELDESDEDFAERISNKE